MPSKLFPIKHRSGWVTQNSHEGFGSENPRSWSIVWGHLINASKTMKERLTAVETEGQAGPLKGDGQSPVNWRAHSPWDTAVLESAQVRSASSLLPTHTCRTDSSKAALPAVCRACSLQVSFLIHDRCTWYSITMYFFRQEYILNPYFTSWLKRSKQPADFLELNTFATNFIFKLTTVFSKTFQNYVKNKTTTQANKKPKDQEITPSLKTRTCNTSCYYLSSSKICKINGERNISKKSNRQNRQYFRDDTSLTVLLLVPSAISFRQPVLTIRFGSLLNLSWMPTKTISRNCFLLLPCLFKAKFILIDVHWITKFSKFL